MELHKALKVRIYPTEEQKTMIAKTIGCCRKVYNEALDHRTRFYQDYFCDTEAMLGRKLTTEESGAMWKFCWEPMTGKILREKFEFLKEVGSCCLAWSLRDLDAAFKNFFDGRAEYPEPHGRGQKESFRAHGTSIAINYDQRVLSMPKIPDIKFRCSKFPDWFHKNNCSLKSIIVSRKSSGKYFASLLFEYDAPEVTKELTDKFNAIGLDFSPADMYIDSDGRSGSRDFGYIAEKQRNARRLKMLQRRMARKQKGSRNFVKAKRRLAKFEEYIAEKREMWQGKESKRLVSSYQVIGVEDLALQGMMKGSRNAKNYNDTGWGMFVTKLEQKSVERNCRVVRVDRFFPSSKTCHVCGYKNDDLKLSDRSWTCPQCGTRHSRDHNAAINLRNEAVRIIEAGEDTRKKRKFKSRRRKAAENKDEQI
jgi:putative transposase